MTTGRLHRVVLGEQGVDVLDACSIGQALTAAESGIGGPVDAFQGQMGAIHLFDDIITARTPRAVPTLSPNAACAAGYEV